MYPEISLYIDGQWCQGSTRESGPVHNPATGAVIAQVPHASADDLDRALAAAQRGFEGWRRIPAHERVSMLRRAANLLRERADTIAPWLTAEQGKPLAEARAELLFAPEHIDWCADEARRLYGRLVPSRQANHRQLVVREPVGPVAGFSPWNFPVAQMIRKIAGALAAGCSIIVKAPEETPASCMEAVRCFHDAGVPPGVINLVFGVPAMISAHLIPSPVIRKVSFTGSVPVGKQLAMLAAQHMKRNTMELGGHAAVIIMPDTDVIWAANTLAAVKFRNAGQVCISPTRFYVHQDVHADFVAAFTHAAQQIVMGDGSAPGVQMGPLAAARRVPVMQGLVDDALRQGARLETGGVTPEGPGFFYPPTVLSHVSEAARLMTEEPFGPVVPVVPFTELSDVIERANRLPFGLAAYAFTQSLEAAAAISSALEVGMVSINGAPVTSPETPFGGIKDSGYGSEGGIEGLESYVTTKLISEVSVGAAKPHYPHGFCR